jgi:hypothetical protein
MQKGLEKRNMHIEKRRSIQRASQSLTEARVRS